MIVLVDYASPSVLDSTREATTVGLSTNRRRRVRFHGRVRQHGFVLRIALRALGEVIWSNDMWFGQSDLLDPVITVHRDRIFFEAFSQDQSAYAALSSTQACSNPWARWSAALPTSTLPLGCGGAGRDAHQPLHDFSHRPRRPGRAHVRGRRPLREKKVELPESWVRGFLQVQAAMGMPGTRLRQADRSSLRLALFAVCQGQGLAAGIALRFRAGQDARLVLEPWERVVDPGGRRPQLHRTQDHAGVGAPPPQADRGVAAVCRRRRHLPQGPGAAELLCREIAGHDLPARSDGLVGERFYGHRRL